MFFHNEGAQARVPQGSGPAVAKAEQRLRSWGLQIDLSAELEMGTALFLPSPDRFSASSQGWEARAAVSSARSRHRHFNYLILRNYMLFVSMQEILRIRHLSLVLMRSLLRL